MSENTSVDNLFFKETGEVTRVLRLENGQEFPITLKILDNLESDQLIEKFTEIDEFSGTTNIRMADLSEERLLKCIIDAPFTCRGTPWKKASDDNKRYAIRHLKADIRAAINNLIMGINTVSPEEEDFLSKPSNQG
jgi:hypothetical protein